MKTQLQKWLKSCVGEEYNNTCKVVINGKGVRDWTLGLMEWLCGTFSIHDCNYKTDILKWKKKKKTYLALFIKAENFDFNRINFGK